MQIRVMVGVRSACLYVLTYFGDPSKTWCDFESLICKYKISTMKILIIPFVLSAFYFLGCSAGPGNGKDQSAVSGTGAAISLSPEDTGKVVRSDAEWKKILSPDVYQVTRKKGTERAYSGKYWDNHEKGIYSCICCGLPLFSSDTKFESNTGWPSFYQAISPKSVDKHTDRSSGMVRDEISVTAVMHT